MQVDQATSSAGLPSLASSSVFAAPPQSATPAPASNGLDSSNDMSRLFAATGLAHQDAAQRSLKRKASEEHPEGISRAGSVNSSLAVSSASSHKLAESTLSRDPSPVESELPVPSFMQTSSPDRITPPPEDAPNADDGQATRRSARKAPVPTSFVSIDGSITFPTPASTGPSAPATPYATLASPDRYRASAFSPTKKDKSQKPPYSYAALIGQAINSKPNKRISLNDIYGYIIANYSYYKKEDAGWQNSIRHNLSLNECFVKSPRTPADQPGKGSLWCIVQGCEEQFANGGFVKRLGGKKTKATPKKAKGDGEAAATGQASDAETTASGTSVKEPPVAPPPPKSPSKRGKKAAKKAPPPKTPVASDGETESPSSPVKDEEDDDYEAEGPVAPVRAVRRSRRHSKATAPEPAPKSDPEPEPSDSDDDSERTLLDNKPSPFGPFSGSRAGWQDDILRRDREAPQDASGPSPWTRKKLSSSHRRGASFQDMSNDFLRSPSNTRMSALTTAASVLSPSNPPFPFMPSASPSNLLQSPEMATTHIFSQGSPYLGAASLLSAAAAHHTQSPVSSMRSAFEERPGSPQSPGDHLSTKARNRAESSPAAPGSLIGSPEQQRWAGPNARRLSFEGTDNATARSHDGALAASRALQFLQRDGPRGLNIEGVPSRAHANGSAPDEGEKGGV